jgi:integrase
MPWTAGGLRRRPTYRAASGSSTSPGRSGRSWGLKDIGKLLAACRPGVTQNAALVGFYLRFLALTGSREQEALAVRWEDIDFGNRQVVIGADGRAKNARHRSVNFSAELATLLGEMHAARQPDSAYLFPSPRRGAQDRPAASLRQSFGRVRAAAGLRVGFHDFRHFFASQCAMQGIDFMTIAAWLGHSDGGVLVGKIYGHLADDHKVRMAANLAILKETRPGR